MSSVQEKYNANHICNLKFSNSYIKKNEKGGKVTFNNIFYLAQHIWKFIISVFNQYRHWLIYFTSFFFHTKPLKIVYFTLTKYLFGLAHYKCCIAPSSKWHISVDLDDLLLSSQDIFNSFVVLIIVYPYCSSPQSVVFHILTEVHEVETTFMI